MRTIKETIPPEYDGRKLYGFLKGKMKMSSRLIRSLKQSSDGLLVNGKPFRTIDIVHAGDELTVNIVEEEKGTAPGETLPDVVFEDEDLLIVNKPSFLAIHESHNHQGDALSNCVALYLSEKGEKTTFRAVGRLDKGTSGLVVCALNSFAASKLNGRIEKEYLAIPTGRFEGSGTIDAPIYRPDPMKTYRIVDEKGERAVTHWEAIKSGEKLSLVRVKLETGRTHQIRVHFAHLGAPLYGDTMYGIWKDAEGHGSRQNFSLEPGKTAPDIDHQCLHCSLVSFIHPVTGENVVVGAPPPGDMQKIIDKI